MSLLPADTGNTVCPGSTGTLHRGQLTAKLPLSPGRELWSQRQSQLSTVLQGWPASCTQASDPQGTLVLVLFSSHTHTNGDSKGERTGSVWGAVTVLGPPFQHSRRPPAGLHMAEVQTRLWPQTPCASGQQCREDVAGGRGTHRTSRGLGEFSSGWEA